MQLEVIGVGGAGGRIAETIRKRTPTEESSVNEVFAFDTDADSLAALDAIPEDQRHRFGDTVDHGLNGNFHRGQEIATAHVDELGRHLDAGQPSLADAFLVVLGLGGATGGAVAPELVANIQRLYDAPVYVLGTLPADREFSDDELVDRSGTESETETETRTETETETETRPRAAENAADALDGLEAVVDAVIWFDNEDWLRPGESIADARDRLNQEIATRFEAFFGSTAPTRTDGRTHRTSGPGAGEAESIVDLNDVRRILGEDAAAVTLGYGKQEVDADSATTSILGVDLGVDLGFGRSQSDQDVDTAAAYSAVETTIRKALHGKLTLDCDREDADRVLLLVGGPPNWLDRQAIADGRRTVADETGSTQILSGDAPRPDGDAVFAVAVLAGVDPVDRLDRFRDGGQ